MNWYQRHLGDYARDTRHLTMMEHGAYNLLLDHYYATEKPIPDNQANAIAGARHRHEKNAVKRVLTEFFFRSQSGLWEHKKVISVIAEAKHKSLTAQENIRKRWDKNHPPDDTPVLPANNDGNTSHKPSASNQQPLTIENQIPSPVARKRATEEGERLTENWVPDAALAVWAMNMRPGVNLQREVESFRDYWNALPGKRAKKLDWNATFRNHIRRGMNNGSKGSAADRVTGHIIRARAQRALAGIAD